MVREHRAWLKGKMKKLGLYFIALFVWLFLLLKVLSLLTSHSDWIVALGATLLMGLVVVLGALWEAFSNEFSEEFHAGK